MKRQIPNEVEAIKRRCIERVTIKRSRNAQNDNDTTPKRSKMETYEDGLRDGKKAWEECFNVQSFMYNLKLIEELGKAFQHVSEFYEKEIEKLTNKSSDISWVM